MGKHDSECDMPKITQIRSATDRLWCVAVISASPSIDVSADILTEYRKLIDDAEYRNGFYKSIGIESDELKESER